MTDDCKKEITRQLILFKKCGNGYNVMAIMKGYTIHSQDKHGAVIHEMLPLGYCEEYSLEEMVNFFKKFHHDIEVSI